jgi:hypothetical protein
VGSQAYYPGRLLPANYADLHTPWIYYLYAPFYAVYQDGRTLLWLQAAVIGAGAFGVNLLGRAWLRSNWMGAAFGLVYLLYPHVQIFCLHDVHANYIAIPLLLVALGLMQARRPRWAFAFAFLVAICREETAVYAATAGLYWALSPSDRAFAAGRAWSRTRRRVGWLTLAMAVTVLFLITNVVMVAAGGKPRYSHFSFYFDSVSIGSMLKSYVLNPLGAVQLALNPMRLEFFWLSLLPVGFLALFGWRAAFFLLIPIGLLIPAVSHNFWAAGINYSAPIVAPAIIMALMGAREALLFRLRLGERRLTPQRLGLGVFALVAAGFSSVLYGNLFGKTYKLEFGSVPYRQANELDYIGELGIVTRLPPYGERERQLWELIHRLPDGVPISTSWRLNPQLSNREVSVLYPDLGEGRPAENLVKYVIIDRLPPTTYQTEAWELEMRKRRDFRVVDENRWGVVFAREQQTE